MAFTALQTRLYFPIGQLLQVSVELRSSLALFNRVFESLDVVPDIVDAPDAVDLPVAEAGGRVALRDVYFRYPGVPTARCRASASERTRPPGGPGGPSSAGKTTISYLIPRLYDVTAGAVEVDGLDVRHVRQASLAAAIGFVTQESYLFHDTVLANIRYGRARRLAARRWRTRRGRRTSTTGSWSSPTATTPWSASAGTGCRAGRSSGWPSPASCCTTRAS